MAKETIVLDIQTNGDKAEGSVKSLKAQLKEAQAEVGKMADKFGETSAQAVQAAKRAAELKDRIGDAKALTDAFNPDKKFQAFSQALSGVAGGFSAVQGAMGLMGAETKDVEKTLLKVQSAMALSQGLSAITESADAFKNLKAVAVNAFQAIKGAIGASGIGLLLIALGTVVAYWDDIKEAVSGVSNESKKLLETQKKSQESAQKSLDAVSKQENILKLQGKSEREILQLKMKGTAEVIKSLEAQIITQEEIKKQQIATAQRNQDILKGILDFLTFPLRGLLKTVDMAGKALGQDFGLAEGLTKNIAEFVFDPKKVEQEGNKGIEETKAKLTELKNTQAGYQLDIKKQNEDAAKQRKAERDKEAEEIKQANQKLHEDTKKQNEENFLNSIKDERDRAEAKLTLDYTNKIREITLSKASAEEKAQALLANETKYNLDLQALKDKNAEEDQKKAKENADKLIKAEKDTFDLITQARLSQIKDAGVKRQEEEALRYQSEIDNLYNSLNNKEITEADFNARREAVKTLHDQKLTENEKTNAEERKKTAEAEYQAKVSLWNQTGNALGQLADVIGKSTGVGKALAVAQIAIDTGVAISALTRNSQANPANAPTGGIAGAIQFATGIIQIMANIKKAKELLSSAKVPGGGGGGGGAINIPTSAPVAPQMSQTALNQQLINQTGNATTRAFVLESDVSGNQERIKRLNRAARIN